MTRRVWNGSSMSHSDMTYNTSEIAKRLQGELFGSPDVVIRGVGTVEDAADTEITVIANRRYCELWKSSNAAAAVISRDLEFPDMSSTTRPLIVVPDAELAMIEVLQLFLPAAPVPEVGVHPTAWVHPEAKVHDLARIGPHVSVDRGASIDERVVLHAGVRIYADVEIGSDSVLHANCVIRERCRLGRRVICHPCVTIGADGFGYRPHPEGAGLLKFPHIGTVSVEDDVEIGANSCIDRGKFGTTVIGRGTKIDNLCQIGHNCRIGRNCVIAGLSGFSGSVIIGNDVKIGGAVRIAEHITVGDGASLGGGSGVIHDIGPGETHLGYPADLAGKTLRQWAAIRKLPDLVQDIARQGKGEQ